MRFRNAFRIMTDNFSNVYKLLLFRLISGLLFFSLGYVIISLGLHAIVNSAEAHNIVRLLKEFFKQLTTGSNWETIASYRDEIFVAVRDFLALIGANVGSIVGAIIGIVAIYLLAKFINGTSTFAIGSIINDKMSAYAKTAFGAAYFQNLGRSALYQIFYVPISFVYDALSLLGCWFFFLYAPSFLPTSGFLTVLIGISLSITAYVCLQALKLTFISRWMPGIITGNKRVAESGAESFKAIKGFSGRFSTYLLAIFVIVAVNIMFGLFTLGSFLLITIPASYIFILCLQFVHYYEDTGKKFFLSFRKISGADDLPETME